MDLNLVFKKDKRVSVNHKANLNLQDINGYTLIHHVVMATDSTSYDNVRMLMILINAGASHAIKDKKGMIALEYALENGVAQLSKALQKINKKPINKWVGYKILSLVQMLNNFHN